MAVSISKNKLMKNPNYCFEKLNQINLMSVGIGVSDHKLHLLCGDLSKKTKGGHEWPY